MLESLIGQLARSHTVMLFLKFGNPNLRKTGNVQFDLISDSERKKGYAFL